MNDRDKRVYCSGSGNIPWRHTGVFPVRCDHHLPIEIKAIPLYRPWRPMLPVKYEIHLHVESETIAVTGCGGMCFL
jgi:hypothetical protein